MCGADIVWTIIKFTDHLNTLSALTLPTHPIIVRLNCLMGAFQKKPDNYDVRQRAEMRRWEKWNVCTAYCVYGQPLGPRGTWWHYATFYLHWLPIFETLCFAYVTCDRRILTRIHVQDPARSHSHAHTRISPVPTATVLVRFVSSFQN